MSFSEDFRRRRARLDAAVRATKDTRERLESQVSRLPKAMRFDRKTMARMLAEAGASALIMGYVRGKYEKPDGSFLIPGIGIDAEMTIGAALAGLGYLGMFPKYNEDVMAVGAGILVHYFARQTLQTAKPKELAVSGDGSDALLKALGG